MVQINFNSMAAARRTMRVGRRYPALDDFLTYVAQVYIDLVHCYDPISATRFRAVSRAKVGTSKCIWIFPAGNNNGINLITSVFKKLQKYNTVSK